MREISIGSNIPQRVNITSTATSSGVDDDLSTLGASTLGASTQGGFSLDFSASKVLLFGAGHEAAASASASGRGFGVESAAAYRHESAFETNFYPPSIDKYPTKRSSSLFCFCIPSWIVDASTGLLVVILLSAALFFTSVLVIIIALASGNGNSTGSGVESNGGLSNIGSNGKINFGTLSPNLAPVTQPTPTPKPFVPTITPAIPPTSKSNFPSTKTPTFLPTIQPTSQPSLRPTFKPTPNPTTSTPTPIPTQPKRIYIPAIKSAPPTSTTPTFAPTAAPLVTTFYVSAAQINDLNQIHFLEDKLDRLDHIEELNFLAHLGNAVGPELDCKKQNYQHVAEAYGHSPVPVYIVPGEKEWRDCSPSLWLSHFSSFDQTYWAPKVGYSVDRQKPTYPQNFAFLFRNILHIGVTMLDQDNNDDEDDLQYERLAANLHWVEDSVEKYYDDADVVIIYGHSDLHHRNQLDFFLPLTKRMQDPWTVTPWGTKQFLYIFASDEPWSVLTRFWDVNNFSVVGVEKKIWPPMRITLDFEAGKGTFSQN